MGRLDDEEYVWAVCCPLRREGPETCRFLLMTSQQGWACAKHGEFHNVINATVARGAMTARGDNCDGR